MKILLDTHVLIWTLKGSPQIPEYIAKAIKKSSNKIYFSTISIWEIAIKHSINPDNMPWTPQKILKNSVASGLIELPLKAEAIYIYDTIQRPETAPRHKDPFDRILIAQAKADGNMKFLTHDKLLPDYNEPCIWAF